MGVACELLGCRQQFQAPRSSLHFFPANSGALLPRAEHEGPLISSMSSSMSEHFRCDLGPLARSRCLRCSVRNWLSRPLALAHIIIRFVFHADQVSPSWIRRESGQERGHGPVSCKLVAAVPGPPCRAVECTKLVLDAELYRYIKRGRSGICKHPVQGLFHMLRVRDAPLRDESR